MDVGRLKHRIKLQSYETTRDPNTGAVINAWVDVGQVWASVEGINGREFIQSSAEQAATTWRITVRHRDVNPAWRIVFEGRYFNIKAILPNNDQSTLVLMCETGVNNG